MHRDDEKSRTAFQSGIPLRPLTDRNDKRRAPRRAVSQFLQKETQRAPAG